MKDKKEKIFIYKYDDFRLFIKDKYEEIRQIDPECSTARKFAHKAGFTNPGFINDVVKGKRNLSIEARKKLEKIFRLNESEVEFFKLLVEYGRSKKEEEKDKIYKKIVARRNRSAFTKLNPAISKYYQDYRYSLIYNALMSYDFRGDYNALSDFIYPPISPSILREYIEELCSWGMVIKQRSGRYTVTQRFIEPPETLREQIKQLNREWILHAADLLMKLPSDRRHVSTMLLSISPETAKKIAEKIEEFRDEIWRLVQNEPNNPSCIMQLNLQYLPRSKIIKEKINDSFTDNIQKKNEDISKDKSSIEIKKEDINNE